jgi:hypothetical protein
MESRSERYGSNVLQNVAAMIGVLCAGGNHGAECSRFDAPRTASRHPANDDVGGAAVAIVLFAAVLAC